MSDSQSHDSGSSSSSSNGDSGYVPGNGTFAYLQNFFLYVTGRMPEEKMRQLVRARDIENEAADCKRCEDQRDFLMQYSPIIRFLSDSIHQLGGNISNQNIHCRRCSEGKNGGFDLDYGILVCANEMIDQNHLEDTIAHEMVHAYDHHRFKVDWANNLRHAACAEIRASSLSGECRWAREFFKRGQWKLTRQHQECVRRRATLSVLARPTCKDEAHAERVVNEVWNSCFRDTRPFDEIYR